MPPRASLRPHAGNAYDKYATANPAARRLVAGFLRDLDDLWRLAQPHSQLDVGCGEGFLTERWAQRLGGDPIIGLDRGGDALAATWAQRRGNLRFVAGDACELPYEDGCFDLVSGIELLEQVDDADRALREMTRVARRWVLVSVPREPVWRVLNVARGVYVRWLGNPPGHVNHWSRRAFERLVAEHGEVVTTRTPFPWTMVLLRVDGG